jgi:Xaa-Pro dipeptidase
MMNELIYSQHIQCLQQRTEQLLVQQGYEGLLIHAGIPRTLFLDDQTHPFKANPHFRYWVPLTDHPHCALLIRTGHKPRLYYHNPTDFWHKAPGDPEGAWTALFELQRVNRPEAIGDRLPQGVKLAFIGEPTELAGQWGIEAVNPGPLLYGLHWERGVKTAYEVECLREANRIAVRGHRAAEQAFRQGGSELAIQFAYLRACGQREQAMPYGNIIALNENASILHYQHYESHAPGRCRSLLIDAGAEYQGYCADITRTYVNEDDEAASGLFQDLMLALEAEQLSLIGSLEVGQSYLALHQQMHGAIARLLKEFDLVRLEPEQQLAHGLTSCFFPHGMGHLLGLQVHDVGGLQGDASGTPAPAPESQPLLRLTRTLQAGMVFTVEPGLYFIDSLLRELKASSLSSTVNWERVEQLRPYGGIRIEDDICLHDDGAENLTRDAFAEYS